MKAKEQLYVKTILTYKIEELTEKSSHCATDNGKKLYEPNIKALKEMIKLIDSIPDEDSISLVTDILSATKDKVFLNLTINQIDNVINYLLNSV